MTSQTHGTGEPLKKIKINLKIKPNKTDFFLVFKSISSDKIRQMKDAVSCCLIGFP